MAYSKGFKTSYNRDPDKYSYWSTPQWLFEQINEMFHFTTDVCAAKNNAKCKNYFTQKDDGLTKKWKGCCWCNPPYGAGEIDRWMKKAHESSLEGATVVCLVPSSTSTRWWHDYAMKGEISFIKGKVRFIIDGKSPSPAPFHSAIVVFRPHSKL
jgi:phage N-6-adenine-methyltransferase